MGAYLSVLLLAAFSGESIDKPFRTAQRNCDAAARQMYGAASVRPEAKLPPPKKLKDVRPAYPVDDQHRVGRGRWVGEALVGTDGRVKRVWVITSPVFEPPWPEWELAIPDAINKWEYSPILVDGTSVAACIAISVDIHWR